MIPKSKEQKSKMPPSHKRDSKSREQSVAELQERQVQQTPKKPRDKLRKADSAPELRNQRMPRQTSGIRRNVEQPSPSKKLRKQNKSSSQDQQTLEQISRTHKDVPKRNLRETSRVNYKSK